jgi:hypothetical protein
MSLTLHLGIIEQNYTNSSGKSLKAAGRVVSTGDVAGYLEERYHIYEHFFQIHSGQIGDAIADDMAGSLETMLMGGSTNLTLGTATSKIDAMFKKMLSERELDQLGYPGIPTQAAKDGVNHRMKHPYAKRRERPSFIDTGLYQASFKSWIE